MKWCHFLIGNDILVKRTTITASVRRSEKKTRNKPMTDSTTVVLTKKKPFNEPSLLCMYIMFQYSTQGIAI